MRTNKVVIDLKKLSLFTLGFILDDLGDVDHQDRRLDRLYDEVTGELSRRVGDGTVDDILEVVQPGREYMWSKLLSRVVDSLAMMDDLL